MNPECRESLADRAERLTAGDYRPEIHHLTGWRSWPQRLRNWLQHAR